MYKHALSLIKNKILVYITMEELKGIQSLTPLSRAFLANKIFIHYTQIFVIKFG